MMTHFQLIGTAMIHAPLIGQLARVAAVIFLAVSFLGMSLSAASSAELQTLEIVTKTGVHVFSVELAVTEREKTHGLMFRRSVPDFTGMLFDFGTDQPQIMWMKDTYVSLDMIFIQSDGRIRRIAENTRPQSKKLIRSGGPVRAVLEVAAGTARKLGIEPGDRVESPVLLRR
jgi:uncharacterized membrane protein (UPF0127 family)